jgi:hypothetical protein
MKHRCLASALLKAPVNILRLRSSEYIIFQFIAAAPGVEAGGKKKRYSIQTSVARTNIRHPKKWQG